MPLLLYRRSRIRLLAVADFAASASRPGPATAENSIAFGPDIAEGGVAGVNATFVIEARD